MLSRKDWQWPVTFVCLCLGFLLAIQLKTQSVLDRPVLYGARVDSLIDQLRQTQRERDVLTKELNSLRAAVSGASSQRPLGEQLRRLQIQAGLTKVKGPGVVITLRDNDRPSRPGEPQDAFIVHDSDLLTIVNELWASGAEAVAVNGHRVVTTTAIRCVGPVVRINNTHNIGPPYTIEAIGNPDDLMQVNMRGGALDYVRAFGIKTEIVASEDLLLPNYTGSIGGLYATPIEEGDAG